MKQYKSYEKRYTSAYCRLDFEIWHPGYKDDLSRYIEDYSSLDAALEKAKNNLKETKLIRVDGKICLAKYDMKECIEAFLFFLYKNEGYEIMAGFDYEELKEADASSYRYTDRLIDGEKFIDEMNEKNYMLMVWNINRKSERYLKVLSDKSILFAIKRAGEITKRETFNIETELYEQLIKWSKKQISNYKRVEIMEGINLSRIEKFQVEFNFDALGFDEKSQYFSGIGFNTIEGQGAISELLKKLELKEFTEGAEE